MDSATAAGPRQSPPLLVAAAIAVAAVLARRADGAPVLSPAVSIALEVPALWLWLARCRHRAGVADRLLTIAVLGGAAAVAVLHRDGSLGLLATTVFICGVLLVEALAALYDTASRRLDAPRDLLALLARAWLALVVLAVIL